jgi:CBS domain-containing protein
MEVRETASQQTRKGSQTARVSSGARKISSSAMLSEAADRMEKLDLDSLPVVEDNRIVGRITRRDVATAVSAGLNPTITPVKYAMTVEK